VRGGTLYVVATPIGNLRDVTLRALDVLASVDVIAAEDTRQTQKLLARHGISARPISVRQHNERAAAEGIGKLLSSGKSVALVTDAGTPGVSDPGARVVAWARKRGFRVMPVPGPSALTAALSVCGIAWPRFLFAGFLPAKRSERARSLEALASAQDAMVFFEAPHRVVETLQDMARAFGADRRVVIARELTKLFEEVHECTLAQAVGWIAENRERGRGEFVLLVEGAHVRPQTSIDPDAERMLRALLGELSTTQAAKLVAKITGAPKARLYRLALEIKSDEKRGATNGETKRKPRA
jgi:16S rRNA (cytidine1402-2'-O)-methyltransferase